MAKAVLKRFSRPALLRELDLDLLRQFLARFPECATPALTALAVTPDPDFDGLAAALAGTGVGDWNDLRDALCDIDSLATDGGRDELSRLLLAEPPGAIVPAILPTHSEADAVLLVWLTRPDVIARALEHRILRHSRRFKTFLPVAALDGAIAAPKMTDAAQEALEAALVSHHKEIGGQTGTRLSVVGPNDDEVWFLIHHGQPLSRLSGVEGNRTRTHALHLEATDVVVYTKSWGALRVRANDEKSIPCYREQFGLHLFGDAEHFGDDGAFTLNRLRADGRSALYCDDIPGIVLVRLVRLSLSRPGVWREVVEYRAVDLLAAWEERGQRFPSGRIISATFEITFKSPGEKKTRKKNVSISVPSATRVSQDQDGSLVTEWLRAREMCRNLDPEELPGFWRIFEREGALDATLEEWHLVVGPDWDACAALFSTTDAIAPSMPCAHLRGIGCARQVAVGDTGATVTCDAMDRACGSESLPLGEARLHRFNVAAFQSAQRALWAATGPTPSGKRTELIGRYRIRDGHAPRVFLSLAPSSTLSDVVVGLMAEDPASALVLVPTDEGLTAVADDLIRRNKWEVIALSGVQRVTSGGRMKMLRSATDVLAQFRARLLGASGSVDAGHHALMIARLPEDPASTQQTGLTLDQVNVLTARTDLDLFMDFSSGTIRVRNFAPVKMKSRAFGVTVRQLVTAGRALMVTEMTLPSRSKEGKGAQTKFSELKSAIRNATGVDWIHREGERGAFRYSWRPPENSTYALLFPVDADV